METIRNYAAIVNSDVFPSLVENEKIANHVKSGIIDLESVKPLIISTFNPGEKEISGLEIKNRLVTDKRIKLLLNATVMEQYYKYPRLIPKEWEEENIIIAFFGTEYFILGANDRKPSARYIRYLWRYHGRWSKLNRALNKKFDFGTYVACLAA